MDPSQQHSGLRHAVWRLQQEVTRPKARFKPTSPKKSGVDEGANQVPTYLGQSLHPLYIFHHLSFWSLKTGLTSQSSGTFGWLLHCKVNLLKGSWHGDVNLCDFPGLDWTLCLINYLFADYPFPFMVSLYKTWDKLLISKTSESSKTVKDDVTPPLTLYHWPR